MKTDTRDSVLNHGIGAQVDEIHKALRETAQTLDTLSDGEFSARITKILEELARFSVRIAVVGQIKAGKSTLVNALTRRSGLLPSDVIPWTSVVTQLHFGGRGDQKAGAVFRFFDHAQWDALVERGGRLAELTEGFVDQRDRDVLETEIAEMKSRAQMRLSRNFESLLGKEHVFDTVTSEVMARYVSAGDAPDEPLRNPAAGRFADITRSADIYFDQAPFGCPVSIIDTPGINDPLLIRDELTHRALEEADYFVVVLSAHQPLSKDDLRLIRLLRALDRERFVIFINRIDEVRDAASKIAALRETIGGQLSEYLNGQTSDIVVGSAHWATYAVTGEEKGLDLDTITEFADQQGLVGAAQMLDPNGEIGDDRALAYVSSGLDRLEQAVSHMIAQGATCYAMAAATDDLVSLTGQAMDRLTIRIDLLTEETGRRRVLLTDEEQQQLYDDVANTIETEMTGLEAWILTACGDLADSLCETAMSYADKQRDYLKTAIATDVQDDDAAIVLDPLRKSLTKIYKARFDQIQGQLWDDLRRINDDFRDVVPEGFREPLTSVRLATLSIIGLLPRSTPFNQTVTFDLSQTWLRSLFKSTDARIEQVIDTIRDQFGDISRQTAEQEQELFIKTLRDTKVTFLSDLQAQLAVMAGAVDMAAMAKTRSRADQRAKLQVDLKTATTLLKALTKLQQGLSRDTVAA
ncbi:dynamin family protein [Actibacterium sp. 188UL27-1]|uniref:dynamin family protein n=1 Tax=Actibacterium sp. 188UL27-1 TaxID=2786961 RepID=UPI00195DACC3|nr:dynamin family protein [Actibacterium sp. 188UL27-1]MBM7068695.1 dynamin family protein [Actibacterium sp. 188UL27-1]